MSIRSVVRGMVGEVMNRVVHWLVLPKREYHAFHNLIVPSRDGTTEIDHLVVSRFGIFVVEAKFWSGWLFAAERDRTWTLVWFRHRQQVRNPLHQNHGHVMALAELLGVPPERFHSVVAVRGAAFRTPIPRGVVLGGYASFVRSHRVAQISDEEIGRLLAILRSSRVSQSWRARFAHAARTRARFGARDPTDRSLGER